MIRRFVVPGLASAMLLVPVLSSSWSAPPATSSDEELLQVSPAAAGLLQQLNTAPEQTLKGPVGLPEGVVAKIMTFRATGAKFTNLLQVQSVTKMRHQDLERILAPFEEAEAQRAFEAQRKPVPDPGKPAAKAGGKLQQGQPSQSEGKGSEPGAAADPNAGGPITLVRPGFYAKLPGFEDLDKIDPLKRTEFLERVNSEFCTCGCKNETIAFCMVNDPTCPVVKSRAKKIYDDIMNKPGN